MDTLLPYLVWLPVLLACIGAIAGWVGSFHGGLRLLAFSLGAYVIASQHIQFVQVLLWQFTNARNIPDETVISILTLVLYCVWEACYRLIWNPSGSKGGFWWRSVGVVSGLGAGWALGVIVLAGLDHWLIDYRLVMTIDYPLYTDSLWGTVTVLQAIIALLLP